MSHSSAFDWWIRRLTLHHPSFRQRRSRYRSGRQPRSGSSRQKRRRDRPRRKRLRRGRAMVETARRHQARLPDHWCSSSRCQSRCGRRRWTRTAIRSVATRTTMRRATGRPSPVCRVWTKSSRSRPDLPFRLDLRFPIIPMDTSPRSARHIRTCPSFWLRWRGM